MGKKSFLFLLVLLFRIVVANAQSGSSTLPAPTAAYHIAAKTVSADSVSSGAYSLSATPVPEATHLRISLLTCGPGYAEIYEVFGHTAIRIIDTVNNSDLVYNYGTFNGFEENFEIKFMRGKLDYYLSICTFDEFMQEYVEHHREVVEQVLLLNDKQKKIFYDFLNWNAEPQNRNYKYDFFFDNCSTRIREIFPETVSKDFKFAQVVPPIKNYTFRHIINEYFYITVWERFGINILLGSRIDKVMTNSDIMFLPEYLSRGVKGAVANGLPVGPDVVQLLPGNPAPPAPVDGPMLLTWGLAILTIVGLSFKRLHVLGRVMSMLLLFVTGLLGCLILVMWFGTNHQGCGNNFNILWALPLNIYIAFANPKGKGRYALIAIGLIFVTLLLHIAGIQQLILSEFLPLLLALVYIYGTIYRSDKANKVMINTKA